MTQINPLGVTMSVRDMQPFTYWLEQINFIDRLLIKNYVHDKAHEIARKFFLEHTEYTHLLFLAEDVICTSDMVKLIIKDVEENNFPVISGYSNWDWKHDYVNITLKDMSTFVIMSVEQYDLINPYNIFAGKYDFPFQRIYYQGLVLCCIRRDVVEKIPFRGYRKWLSPYYKTRLGVNEPRSIMFDSAFCIDCHKANIPIICDLRCFCIHAGNTINLINIVDKKKSVTYYSRTGKTEEITVK